jgi:hypothetical protein
VRAKAFHLVESVPVYDPASYGSQDVPLAGEPRR